MERFKVIPDCEAPPPQERNLKMASKRRCRPAQDRARPALQLMAQPGSSQDVVRYLQFAACLGFANPKIVTHLTEMGALFPKELVGAYKAFRRRQAGDN